MNNTEITITIIITLGILFIVWFLWYVNYSSSYKKSLEDVEEQRAYAKKLCEERGWELEGFYPYDRIYANEYLPNGDFINYMGIYVEDNKFEFLIDQKEGAK